PRTGEYASNPACPPAPPDPASSPCRAPGPGRHHHHHRPRRPAAPEETSPTTARTASAAAPRNQHGAPPAQRPAPHHAPEGARSAPAAPRSPHAAAAPAPTAAGSPPARHPAPPAAKPQHPSHPGPRQPQPSRSRANTLSIRKSRTRQRVAVSSPQWTSAANLTRFPKTYGRRAPEVATPVNLRDDYPRHDAVAAGLTLPLGQPSQWGMLALLAIVLASCGRGLCACERRPDVQLG